MASRNFVLVLGNVGRDPEMRYTPDGAAMASISVATTSQWKDKNTGEKREETEWHRISFFGRLAEIAGEYLRKGSQVYIEGRLRTRKWQDKETGQDRYSTEIIADVLQMLGSRGNASDGEARGGTSGRTRPTDTPTSSRQKPPARGGDNRLPTRQPATAGSLDDEDVPFAQNDIHADIIGRRHAQRLARARYF